MFKISKRLGSVLISLTLVLQLSGLGAFLNTQVAQAAQACTQDSAGADDVPGQKDLTLMCVDYANVPTTITTKWNWDDTGTNGNNSLDACALFDTDNDGFANNAVCVTTNGNPATLSTVTTYSCGDTRPDRCTSTATSISSGSTSCSVGLSNTNPFNGGSDAVATCVISLATIGGGSAQLLDVCSYPSQQPNSDPSDCIISKNNSGKLEVKKVLTTSNSDTFNLLIDGVTKASAVVNGGTTGEIVVASESHTVGETAASGSLTNYTKSIVCKDLNGTGSIVAQNATGATLTVPVADLSDVVCVITNTQLTAMITLVKQVANTSSTTTPAQPNDFSLKLGSSPVLSGVATVVTPGTYTASETNLPGYTPGTWTGTGCNANGTITVTANQNITCTIINTAITPTITLKKVVTAGPGVTAMPSAFQLTLNGVNAVQDTPINIVAGTVYTAGEVAKDGYIKTSTTCRTLPSGTPVVTTTVTPTLGTNYECSVTNTGVQPKLKVVKAVSDPNHYADVLLAPTAFTLSVNGTQVTQGQYINGITAGTNNIITEGTVTGYNLQSITCIDSAHNNAVVTYNGGVTLTLGQNVTCTVTNTTVPATITLMKEFVNQWGTTGSVSDFTFNIDGTTTALNTPKTVAAGNYSFGEIANVTGYTLTNVTGQSCTMLGMGGTVTVTLGGTYTCTLTNTDLPGILTIHKVVTNNNGGGKQAADFKALIHTTSTADNLWSLDTPINVRTDTAITVSEDSPSSLGYTTSSIICKDTTNANSPVTLSSTTFTPKPAQKIECTVTNTDVAPELIVIKHVVSANGGNNVAADFDMQITAGQAYTHFAGNETGTKTTMTAGSYSVAESGPGGYSASLSADCAGTLVVGDKKTCTITNTDIAPTLRVSKIVVNDNGGSLTGDDFSIKVDGSPVTFGAADSVMGSTANYTHVIDNSTSNHTYVISEVDTAGYTEGTWTCSNGQNGTGLSISITLEEGQYIDCKITNNDIAPGVTINKIVDNTYGGTLDAAVFPLYLGTTQVANGITYTSFNAATYQVSETQQTGYQLTKVEGDCTLNSDNQLYFITLTIGGTSTCTFTNSSIQPKLKVIKKVINDFGGAKTADEFTINVTGTNVSDESFAGSEAGTDLTLNAGSYNVTEGVHTGYDVSYSEDCTNGTAVIGIEKICTITNTEIQPTITLIKSVINDNSGELGVNDFGLTIGETSVTSGEVLPVMSNTSYILNEQTTDGYSFVSLTGKGCPSTLGSSVKLESGENITCTITNDDIAHPQIHVIKSGPATAYEGDEVTYTFTVTNTGDTLLDITSISDNIAVDVAYQSGDANNNGLLDLDETWIYTANYTIPTNQTENIVNTVTVCATDRILFEDDVELIPRISISREEVQIDTSVTCDNDSHTLDVLHPGLHVAKSGPSTAKAGDKVTYNFTVTNTGDTPLSISTVKDNIAGDGVYTSGDTNNNGLLDLSETWIYTANYTIPTNQTADVANTVVVCAYDTNQLEVCSNDSHKLKIPVTIVLSNTGINSSIVMYLAGAILIALIGTEYSNKRNQ